MTNTKKAAPIWSRLSEQLTRCALCVCDPKHKHGDDSRYQAGGQCNQSGSVRCHTCNERFSLYSLRNCSRAKAHGAGDNVLVNSLSVIVLSCIAMRRNTSHHGADSDYSDSLALRRWRRLISPSSAETINCPVLSPSSFKFSTASAIACGTRASSFLDFALTAFVAISDFLVIRWLTVYTQENGKTPLTWLTPVTNIVADTFIKVIDEKTKPRKCRYHSQGF
ncbi:hypothetical protein DIV16_12030 [Escherichia coli]|nr:hypothetical protein DIV16_12030 [Escherichia coli]